jgi:hypothetical protein
MAVVGWIDNKDIGNCFVPCCLVGVMLHVSDEHNRAFILRDRKFIAETLRYFYAEQPLKLIDGGSHTCADKEKRIIGTGVDMLFDNLMRMMVCVRHQSAGNARLGMCIADERPERVEHFLFNRSVQSSAGSPIRIDNFFRAVKRFEHLIDADNGTAERGEV